MDFKNELIFKGIQALLGIVDWSFPTGSRVFASNSDCNDWDLIVYPTFKKEVLDQVKVIGRDLQESKYFPEQSFKFRLINDYTGFVRLVDLIFPSSISEYQKWERATNVLTAIYHSSNPSLKPLKDSLHTKDTRVAIFVSLKEIL